MQQQLPSVRAKIALPFPLAIRFPLAIHFSLVIRFLINLCSAWANAFCLNTQTNLRYLLLMFWLIGLLTSFVITKPCHAQEAALQFHLIPFSSESTRTPEFPSHLLRSKNHPTHLNLIAPRLMTSQQLLASAQLIRENAVNQGQCIVNNVWLTMEQSKQYEGAKILGPLFSVGLISYRRALTPDEINNPFTDVLSAFNQEAFIAHFKNYDIEFSSRNVVFSIKRNI